MTVAELRAKLIEEAIASVERTESQPFRRDGCLEGLQIARTLDTPFDFETVISMRNGAEAKMRQDLRAARVRDEGYWRHRCATAQIEFVFERLKVAWGLPGRLSGAAVVQVHRLMGTPPRQG